MDRIFENWKDDIAYFKQYTYSKPLIISNQKEAQFKSIQKSLYKCIVHFVENYSKYYALMPISDRLLKLVNLASKKKYTVGTYRSDYIISNQNEIKLIEITCRFALNGYLRSGVFCKIGDDLLREYGVEETNLYISEFNRFNKDLLVSFQGRKKIYIIGDSPREETKFIKKFGQDQNLEVIEVPLVDLASKLDELVDVVVIPHLSHEEWENIPLDWFEKINDRNILLNDIRTIVLVHDKRFFKVLNNVNFLREVLTAYEIESFMPFVAPTYQLVSHPREWQAAKLNKDEYIFKPTNLGKGEGIFYGKLVDQCTWNALLNDFSEGSIIQPYILQRKFSGLINNEIRDDDFFVGTLLYFNDSYYGQGLIRASSHPVTNQGDDRKVAACKVDNISLFPKEMIL